MQKDSRIYIAGHRGLVGSAILENLRSRGYGNLITRTHSELDLTVESAVSEFFEIEKPEYVFLAAAKVGGIVANNDYRADFIYENLMIQNHVIHQSFRNKVRKLMFLGSTCIYPKNAPQPMKEEYLLTDVLEYTNEPYAIAKIAGIKMCESYNLQYGTNFISVMPTNLYGPQDNFDLKNSHVLPALIRKIHLGKALAERNWDVIRRDLNIRPVASVTGKNSNSEILEVLSQHGISSSSRSDSAVSVEIWGTGKAMREFLWSQDMADACVFIMENLDFEDILARHEDEESKKNQVRNTHINIGTGEDITIKDLAFLIREIVDAPVNFYFNSEKPDGTLKKLTDPSKLHNLGWQHQVKLEQGIRKVYNWYSKEPAGEQALNV
ncbi:GDP-L-fucose synthase family protein [Autumnicola edwardsiae]|uniref:GDP-L-fucose synthase n=1 Tax=Autumnicola edwardsiae TaxID=3075594 RepID=A0ABU3CVU6_9FLAO|nr:GDP-L-fucose synthase [Zunongwangia sp. F297]MDT0650431.1 GDP-L-fucose synthase [Zunongwangia sp. F297]